MKYKHYSWTDVESAATSIMSQMYADEWRPDYIVGITRGGLCLATILSHMSDIDMHTLKVKLRGDTDDCESNLWMAEDAFGINDGSKGITGARWDPMHRKNILIVDDINDTGATFKWIKEDWQGGCLANESTVWDNVWGNNVRFATMTDNSSSSFGDVKYTWDEVDKAGDDVWLVYPYEAS